MTNGSTEVKGWVGSNNSIDKNVNSIDPILILSSSPCLFLPALDEFVAFRQSMHLKGGEVIGKNIADATFQKGIYEVKQPALMSGTIKLQGTEQDEFVFNFKQNLIIKPNTKIELVGGVKPENVYFNVESQLIIGNSSEVKGNFLSGGSISAINQVKADETRLFSEGNILLGGIPKAGLTAIMAITPMPDATIAADGTTAFCEGKSVTLTANNGAKSWLWSTGESTKSITVSYSNKYTVTVTFQNNCTDIETAEVVAFPVPVAIAGKDKNILPGQSVEIGSLDVLGNTYHWEPSASLNDPNISNPIASPQSGTMYYVTVTNTYGCTDVSQMEIVSIIDKPEENVGTYSLNPYKTDTIIGDYRQDYMYVYDRFGDSTLLDNIIIPSNSLEAGIFRLHFMDDAVDNPMGTGSGIGFDPAASDGSGNARRNVIRQVFTDLSELLTNNWSQSTAPYSSWNNAGNHGFIEIQIRQSNVGMPAGAAGVASSFYLEPPGPGVSYGNVWEYITTGIDPYYNLANTPLALSNYYHAYLQFKFNNPDNLSYSYTNTSIPATTYDFYTTVLHEVIHCLGFAATFGADNGSSSIGGKYSFFSTYLETTSEASVISFADNCYSAEFSGVDISGACNIRFNNNNGFIHPIYSPTSFAPGSSLSHVNCSSVAGYVMNWMASPGDIQHSPHPDEVEILCALGYNFTGQYGDFNFWQATNDVSNSSPHIGCRNYTTCNNNNVLIAGVNDFRNFTTANDGATFEINLNSSSSITISKSVLIANDFNATDVDCLVRSYPAGGNLTETATEFTYEPPSGFVGIAMLNYIPVNANGQHGNITSVFIEVNTSDWPDCPFNSTCGENLLCNGEIESLIFPHAEPMSNMGISDLDNSPDIFPLYNSIVPFWPDFQCGYSGTGVYTGPATPQSTQFIGLGNHPTNREAVFFKTKQSLIPGDYLLSFFTYTGCAVEVNFLFSESRPCEDNIINPGLNVTTNCNGGQPYTPIQIVQINTVPSVPSAAWQMISQTVTITEENINYIVLTITAGTFEGFSQYSLYDDISLVRTSPDEITVESTVTSANSICMGDNYSIAYHVCSNGAIPSSDVQLQYDIPFGVDLITVGSDFDTEGLATIHPADWSGGCVDLVLNLTVNNYATPGQELINRMQTNPGACINGDAVEDIIVPGVGDILIIEKNISSIVGNIVTFTITLQNTSTVSAMINDIVVEDQFSSAQMIFLSGTGVTEISSGVLHTAPVTLDMGESTTLTYTAQIAMAASFCNSTISNTATVIQANGVCGDLSLLNSTTEFVANYLQLFTSNMAKSCKEICNGQATIGALSGTPPYSYLWNDPLAQSNATAVNLCSSNYIVTVTDVTGCSSMAYVHIQMVAAPEITITEIPIDCNGACNGSLFGEATGGDFPPFSYSWGSYGTGQNIQNLCAGVYFLDVLDNYGCTFGDDYSLGQPEIININSVITNEICTGECNGSISTLTSGGTAPFSYNWSNTLVTAQITDLCPGPYSVTVTDDNNCTASFFENVGIGSVSLQWPKYTDFSPWDEKSNDVAVDDNGNIYVTGYVKGQNVDFGSGYSFSGDLNSAYIIKYGPCGEIAWVKVMDGGESEGKAIAIDNSGDIVIAGIVVNTVDFSGVGNSLTASSFGHGFIAKYNAYGSFIWCARIGDDEPNVGLSYIHVNDLTIDADNNYHIIGEFRTNKLRPFHANGIQFAMQKFNTMQANSISDPKSYDHFVAKYSPTGNNVDLGSGPNTSGDDMGNAIEYMDANGANTIYYSWSTGIQSFLKAVGSDNNTMYNATLNQAFLINDLAHSNDDHLYVAGKNVVGAYDSRVYTDRFTYDLNGTWGTLGNLSDNFGHFYATGLTVDNSGDCYVTGVNDGDIYFGGITIENDDADDNVFMIKYNSSGTAVSGKRITGSGINESSAIQWSNAASTPLISGHFDDVCNFYGGLGLNAYGGTDIFTCRLEDMEDPTSGSKSLTEGVGGSGSGTKQPKEPGEEDAQVVIYPNPADKQVHIELHSLDVKETEITLYDLAGKQLEKFHGQMNENTIFTIDLRAYAAGVYYIRITGDRINRHEKLVIKMSSK